MCYLRDKCSLRTRFRRAPHFHAQVIVMNFLVKNAKQTLPALLLALSFATAQAPALAAAAVHKASQPAVMTLEHLKNSCYQIPDLACGYKTVQLKNGIGYKDGIQVVFGTAVFGQLNKLQGTCAVVHIAYHDDSLGWLQQLIFVEQQNGKLVQIAEYNLEDQEVLQNLRILNGEAIANTTMRDPSVQNESATIDKITRMRLSPSNQGYMLTASEWQKDKTTSQLKPFVDIRPYMYMVEDRIGKHWAPSQTDRGEQVVVTFKIKPSGDIEDVRIANSSEVATADQAALEAVAHAAPFPAPPSTQPLDLCFAFQVGVNALHSSHRDNKQ
jgi:TonB family protein